MKEGWRYIKLKDIGITQTGSTPPKSDKENYGDYIPFVRPAELDFNSKGGINFDTELKLSAIGVQKTRLIESPSVLMCCIGSVGKTGFCTRNVTCNQQINTITPYDDYSPKFIYYALISPFFQQEAIKIANSAKATLAIISKGKWENLTIPVPPRSEQQSIVSYLDSSFAKIDAMKVNAEKALEEAKALFQATLKEMLEPKEGWEEKTLGEICRVVNGRAYLKPEMLSKGKYKILRVGNFFTNDKWYYSDLELEEDKYCDNGDLLYAWSASFGPRIWVGGKVIYHYHIWKMICSTVIDKYFMFYWLDSDQLKNQAMTNLHGATMNHITKGIIENCIVKFPPLSEQQSIVTTLDTLKSKVDSLQANYDKISQECDALKQAILRQVFE